MAKTPPIVKDGILTYYQHGSFAQVELDSSTWYTWLETSSSFAFSSEHGSFTARQERAQLGEEPFAVAWQEGREMTLEEALVMPEPAPPHQPAAGPLVPRRPVPNHRPPAPTTAPDELTAREVEVLRLLAQGLSNTQMAERLIISPRTIHAHIRSIYSKLGLTSRVAATRYAIDHHLLSSSLPDHA